MERAEEAAHEILAVTEAHARQLVVKPLDLASLKSVHEFCQGIIEVG
jgi:hypothetical protein